MQPELMSAGERIVRWRQRVLHVVQVARTEPEFLAASSNDVVARGGDLATLGWRALNAGRPAQARAYFRAALHHDPYAISGWVGLSRTVNEREERRAYLQAALDLHYLVTSLENRR